MNNEEFLQKTRKNWLIITAFLFLVIPTAYSFLGTSQDEFHQIGLAIGSFIFFALLYYFAYVKAGTRLLLLAMLSRGFRLAPSSFALFVSFKDIMPYIDFDLSNPLVITFLLAALEIIISIVWIIASMQLRLVNKAIQFKKESSDAYKEVLTAINNSDNLDILNKHLKDFSQKWPKYSGVIETCYNSKKKELSLSVE